MYECTAKWSLLSGRKMFSQLHTWRKPGGRQRQKWKPVITQQHKNISYNRTGWGKLKVGCERSLGISIHGGWGGGGAWAEQTKGRLTSETFFFSFKRFDTATANHCFSPPTPSACNHLGRGRAVGGTVLQVLWVFFKVKLPEWKHSIEERTEHNVMEEAQNIRRILQIPRTRTWWFSAVCISGN